MLTNQQIECLKQFPFRRLSNQQEYSLHPSDFCQPYDIDTDISSQVKLLGGKAESYFMHTEESFLKHVEETTLKTGIHKICLRLISSKTTPPYAKLEKHVSLVSRIRKHLHSVEITVDPFSLAIHPDLQWGILDKNGKIDPVASLKLMADAAHAFCSTGIDRFLTIGRINFEVQVVKEAIMKNNFNTKIVSFSTNAETSYAYINQTLHDPKKAITGQKLLVGNQDEMTLRALCDLVEGTDVFIQKPHNNFQHAKTISDLMSGQISIEKTLNKPMILKLLDQNPYLKESLVPKLSSNELFLTNKKIGAYVISGNYAISHLIEDQFGPALAVALLNEEYLNFKAAASNYFDTITDRNAVWFLSNRQEYLGSI